MNLGSTEYRVGALRVAPALVLSPMSGVTTSAFRRLMRELNPTGLGLTVTEFISVEALTRRVPRTLAMLKCTPIERPWGVQIFGYDIHRLRDGAMMAADAGAELIDINCGCPAPKVVRKGGGCELMRQPAHLQKILQEVRRAIKLPLTIKIRAGWDESSRNAVEVARMAESEGIDGLAIHGRTRAQLYRGDADWEIVREVVNAVRIPVLGSGDVIDCVSAEQRMQCGVAGLFIGRGALHNPFIFTEIAEGRKVRPSADGSQIIQILCRYRDLLLEEFPARACVGKLKQLAAQSTRGLSWRSSFLRAMSLDEMNRILEGRNEEPRVVSANAVNQAAAGPL